MKYVLSQRAQTRLAERKIELAWLERTIAKPQRIEPDADDPGLEHRLAAIPNCGNRVLRVVCDPRQNPPRIVTVHFDRRLKGKP